MSLKLNKEEYCEECKYFEPGIHRTDYNSLGCDTIIFCKYHYRCAHIAATLKEQMERKEKME